MALTKFYKGDMIINLFFFKRFGFAAKVQSSTCTHILATLPTTHRGGMMKRHLPPKS